MKKLKKSNLLMFGITTLAIAAPFVTTSCSSSTDLTNKAFQDEIDSQYEKFLKSNLVSENIYLQNFPFQNNKAILNVNQIASIVFLPNLSAKFDYQFLVNSMSDKVTIEMKMKTKESDIWDLLPSNNKTIYTIENVKNNQTLESEINAYLDAWSKSTVSISNSAGTTLTNEMKAEVLPTFLEAQSSTINFGFSTLPETTNVIVTREFIYNDVQGTISINLNFIDKITNMPLYSQNYFEKFSKEISGFSTTNKKAEQVQNIFGTLSKTFSLTSLINNKKVPFLPSSITSLSNMISFYNSILSISPNKDIQNIIDLLNVENSWYRIELKTTNANDITGTLTVEWYLYDKFSNFRIAPKNIFKTQTINNMLSLVIKNSEGENKDQVENGYKAYNLLKVINLNNDKKNISKPSTLDSIDFNYLKNNTNIISVLSGQEGNQEIIFSVTTNKTTNRFKLDFKNKKQNTKSLLKDDVVGVVEFPATLQIEIKDDFNNNGSVEESEIEWVDFLPPKEKNLDGSYSSAASESYLKIGGYLTIETEITNKFYSVVSAKQIVITTNNKVHFNNYLNQCATDESWIQELFSDQIKEKILDYFSNNNEEYQQYSNLLSKYDIFLGLTNTKPVTVNSNKTRFETSEPIEIRLKTKSENVSNSVFIDYFVGNKIQPFPKITIAIQYQPN